MFLAWSAVQVIVLLVIGSVGGRHINVCPQHRGLPSGLVRGENRIRNRALFRLDVRHATKGFNPEEEYSFRVHTTYRKSKFNDATLIVEALDEHCGHGQLIVDSPRLYSPQGCPDIVTTQEKQLMGRANFKWQAPKCGCIHIRVRVHANDMYYLADDRDTTGPLARTICSAESMPSTLATPAQRIEQKSREEKLQLLCEAWKGESAEQMLKQKTFIDQRGVVIKSQFDLDRLAVAMELRKNNILDCCNRQGTGMMECFGDLRRHRIDAYCGNGQSDIPLTKKRYEWIKKKESECCWQIGEARYSCFNFTIHETMMMDSRTNRHGQVQANLDDFDPANDLRDFGPEHLPEVYRDHEKQKTETPKKDEDDELSEDDDKEIDDDTSTRRGRKRNNKSESRRKGGKNRGSKVADVDSPQHEDLEASVEDMQSDEMINETEEIETDKKTEGHGRRAGDEVDDEVDDDVDDEVHDDVDGDVGDVDNEKDETDADEDETPAKSDSHVLTQETCCHNGITAGTRVAYQGLEGCFRVADMIRDRTSAWTDVCDRSFVVCCMRVVDGSVHHELLSNNLPVNLMKPRAHNDILDDHQIIPHLNFNKRNKEIDIDNYIKVKDAIQTQGFLLSNDVNIGASKRKKPCVKRKVCNNSASRFSTINNETDLPMFSRSIRLKKLKSKSLRRKNLKIRKNRHNRHISKRRRKYSKWESKRLRKNLQNTVYKHLNLALD